MTRSDTVTDCDAVMPADTPATLYRQHFTDLVRTAALMTDDRYVAEEIVQDAFAELVARWHRIDPDRALAYLYRSVANGARSALRRRRTVRAHRLEPLPDAPGSDAAVLRAAGHHALLHAVGRLPLRQRQVLVLRYFAELSVADTAEALGLSGAAVTAATHRAVTALAQRREDFR
jgi:RNA polymerase sigma-70 factor (sigma-E family)